VSPLQDGGGSGCLALLGSGASHAQFFYFWFLRRKETSKEI